MKWAKDVKAALAQAQAQNKLVAVFFLKKDQPASGQFEHATLADPSVANKVSMLVVPLKLDPDGPGKALAAKFSVKTFPTTLYLNSQGAEAGRLVGAMPPMLFLDEQQKVLSAHREWPGIERAYRANPKDGEANARMAWVLAIRRDRTNAERHLASAKKAGYRGTWLARAHNMVGDIYQLSNQIGPALEHFRKADAAALNPLDRSYAKVSILSCHLMRRDITNAKEVAKELIKLKGAAPEYVEFAKQVLSSEGR